MGCLTTYQLVQVFAGPSTVFSRKFPWDHGEFLREFPAMFDCVSMMSLFVSCVNQNKYLNSCFINGYISDLTIYITICVT